jgi:hypothetical protein
MEEDRVEQGKKYAKLIAKAWSDESFKERLLTNSRAVLEAEGISVPPGIEVKVLEQTNAQFFLVIPQMPADMTGCHLEERIAAFCTATQCCTGGCIK